MLLLSIQSLLEFAKLVLRDLFFFVQDLLKCPAKPHNREKEGRGDSAPAPSL